MAAKKKAAKKRAKALPTLEVDGSDEKAIAAVAEALVAALLTAAAVSARRPTKRAKKASRKATRR